MEWFEEIFLEWKISESAYIESGYIWNGAKSERGLTQSFHIWIVGGSMLH